MLYRKQDLIEKSLEHYEKAVALEPRNPDPYLDLGKIYQKNGDKEKALECYEKYLYQGGRNIKETQELIESLKKLKRNGSGKTASESNLSSMCD